MSVGFPRPELRPFALEAPTMERMSLTAKVRPGTGTGVVKKLRRAGQVPGVVYGRGIDATAVTVDAKALRGALLTSAGMNVLIEMMIDDGVQAARTVMVKDVQRDIFRRDIIHVDFTTVDLSQTVEAHVPIIFKGTPKGVTEDGGVFEPHLREVVVECLPTQIPEHIDLDVSELLLGKSVHVSDLTLPPDVILVSEPEEVVATVVAPRVIEEAAPAVTPEAAAAAAAPGEAAEGAEVKPEGKGKPADSEKKE
jgi:large subunit ribosomal protein L25